MRFLLPTLRGLENQMSVMFVTPILVSCHLSTIVANHSSHCPSANTYAAQGFPIPLLSKSLCLATLFDSQDCTWGTFGNILCRVTFHQPAVLSQPQNQQIGVMSFRAFDYAADFVSTDQFRI
jgi:hypothetical protein